MRLRLPPGLAGGQGPRSICSTWARAMCRQLLPDREEIIICPRRIFREIVAADAITDNSMRLAGRQSPRKDRLQKLLPDYVCSVNPLGSLQTGCGDGGKGH